MVQNSYARSLMVNCWISQLPLVFSQYMYMYTPKGWCVYRENTRDSREWEVPRSCFVVVLKFFSTLRGTNSKTRHCPLSYFFSAQCPHRYSKSSCCGPFDAFILSRLPEFLSSSNLCEILLLMMWSSRSWSSKNRRPLHVTAYLDLMGPLDSHFFYS